jgi:hypothetical protein
MRATACERFDAKCADPDENGCVLWTGTRDALGYGRFFHLGRLVKPYRFAWERDHGPIPSGLEIDHLCRVPACVNPEHLEPVTHQENVRRGRLAQTNSERAARITHCPRGHAYDEFNTYRSKTGARRCRTCSRAFDRVRRPRKTQPATAG